MELNFIFGDIKSQLDELTNLAKKIDDKKLLKKRKHFLKKQKQ